MNKKDLSERDVYTKFITPAIRQWGWDEMTQIREEVNFTKRRIIVRGKLVTRDKAKRADYIRYYKPKIPIAIVEAKDNNCAIGDGIQQALDYAETLDIPLCSPQTAMVSFFMIGPDRVPRWKRQFLSTLLRR